MTGLTKRQAELLKFLRAYMAEWGMSPSYEEMCAALGAASRARMNELVRALEERGYVTRIPNRARSIKLVEPGALVQFSSEALRAELRRRGEFIGAAA